MWRLDTGREVDHHLYCVENLCKCETKNVHISSFHTHSTLQTLDPTASIWQNLHWTAVCCLVIRILNWIFEYSANAPGISPSISTNLKIEESLVDQSVLECWLFYCKKLAYWRSLVWPEPSQTPSQAETKTNPSNEMTAGYWLTALSARTEYLMFQEEEREERRGEEREVVWCERQVMCRDEPAGAPPVTTSTTSRMITMYPFMEPSHVPGLKLSDPTYSQQGYHLPHPQPHHHPAYSRDFLFRRDMGSLHDSPAPSHHPMFPHPADPFFPLNVWIIV